MKSKRTLPNRRAVRPQGISLPVAVLRRRLRVKLHRDRLDHELADGLHPAELDERDPADLNERALRARQLATPRARRGAARSLRQVVRSAEEPLAAMFSAAVPVSRRAVLPWREALLGLADRLEQPGPVNPCGVARLLVLLTDGGGPLYVPEAARSLGDAVWWIADGLQL
jgi:hypothetical protein